MTVAVIQLTTQGNRVLFKVSLVMCVASSVFQYNLPV